MKRSILLFALLFSAIIASSTAWAQLSGTKTIDPAGTGPNNFTSFKQAIDTLNTYGVGNGGVTFTVASGTYTETDTLGINILTNKPSAANPVTFALANGATVVLNIPVTAGHYAFTIGGSANSVDYVTLNGSNGTGRGLTVNAVGPDGANGILVYGDHCTIKNLIYAPSAPMSTTVTYGIVLREFGSSDFCTVDNCDVTSVYGIVVGIAAGSTQTGNVINGNTVHCLTQGIAANQSSDITITNNEVIGSSTIYPLGTTTGIIATNSATTTGSVIIDNNKVHDLGTNLGTTNAITVTGITGGSKGASYSITRNKVYNLFNATSNSATPGTQVQGISLSNGDQTSMFDISNNFIYGLEDNDPDVGSNWTAGIRPVTAGKIYTTFNTVFIKNTTRNHYAAAFICGGGIDTKDTNFVYSNIFYVDQAGASSSLKSYCMYKGTSYKGTLVSDYNELTNFGANSNSVIASGGATLSAWQTAGFDAHSVSKAVAFTDSVTDLHLAGASVGDAALTGKPIMWVTNDFDGQTRNAKYPYMGADEAATPLAALVVTPGTVEFGEVAKGDSVVKSIYLRSTTKNAIVLQSVSAPTSAFVWSLATPDTVTAADSAELKVAFKPTATGKYSATINVVTDNGSVNVPVSGTLPALKLSGNYTIDSSKATAGTNYQTFADAFKAVNENGLSASATFTIASGTYNEAAALVLNPLNDKPADGKTLSFVMANGAKATLNVATTANQFAITIGDTANSVDFTTFDGSNGAGRGLTVNATSADSSQGVIVYGDHVQIKGLVVTLPAPWKNVNGIVLHQKNSSDYCTVDNCDVTANNGIMVGTATGSTQVGNVINGNTVRFHSRGIAALQSSDLTITNNEVIGDTSYYPLSAPYAIAATNTVTTSGSVVIDHNTIHDMGSNHGTTGAQIVTGINAGSKNASYSITRNKLYNFYNASSATIVTNGTLEVQAINLTGGDATSMYDVSNNIIYGFKDNDPTALTNKFTCGIRSQTSGKVYVNSNTVFVEASTRNHSTMDFAAGGATATDTIFVANNIFYMDHTGSSTTARSYCIYKGGSHLGVIISDYNLLMNNGTGANSYIGNPNGTTFTAWKNNNTAVLPKPDQHSANKAVAFVDSTSNFHLAGTSVGDVALTGTPTPWITNDYDGDVRNAKYPYMGADEASVPLAGIALSATSVDFGTTATVGDSLSNTVYIKSVTKNPITVTAVSAPKSDFMWSLVVPDTVADSTALAISFKPSKAGAFADTVVVTSDFGVVKIFLAGTAKKAPTTFFVDDFTGSVGTLLTAAGWQQSGTSTTNPVTITADNLSADHYSGSGVGNAVTLAATGQDVYNTFGPFSSGSVYLTFMANVKTVGTGDYFIALSPSAAQTNYYARLHVKASGDGYVVGISKNNEVSGGAQYGTTVLPLNQTVLFVVKYTFDAADTTNDPISVYAFTSTIPTTEPTTPEIAGYKTTSKVDAPDLGNVTLRQGSTGAAATLVIDGIRIGTSWAVSVPTGVKVQSTEVPRVFALAQNYPNPFNPSTTINFSLENDGYTTLRVYNILGQPVETIFAGMAQAGRMYRATFNASHLPSGIYFARLESGSKVSIKKMMLMK